MKRLGILVVLIAAIAWLPDTTYAQDVKPSICQAIAKNEHSPSNKGHEFASLELVSVSKPSKYEVAFSFQGHSTYLIETGEGVKIATDYAGYLYDDVVPDVVTMNQAHSSHNTAYPDPRIPHVLRGWDPEGGIAEHHVSVKDTVIRNVTTDILRYMSIPDGNSIFIFEVAGLCIGHLGHLHHRLTDEHFSKIGRLDIVMVPVDGGLTLTHISLLEILERLRSSVVLPMHVRSRDALPNFLAHLDDAFAVEVVKENLLTLSLNTLPARPTVMLLPGVSYYPTYEE